MSRDNDATQTRTAPFTRNIQPKLSIEGNDANERQLLAAGRPFASIGNSSHESVSSPSIKPPHTTMLLSPLPLTYIDTLAIASTYVTVTHSNTLHTPHGALMLLTALEDCLSDERLMFNNAALWR